MINHYIREEVLFIPVIVVPNSKKQDISIYDNTLKVHIIKPPAEGRANREIIEYFTRLLKIKKSQIKIEKGLSSRNKVLSIRGITIDSFLQKIEPNLE